MLGVSLNKTKINCISKEALKAEAKRAESLLPLVVEHILCGSGLVEPGRLKGSCEDGLGQLKKGVSMRC